MSKIAMGRKAVLTGLLGLAVAIIGGAPLDAAAAPAAKVQVCHVPPGNPANAHFISVAASAVPAHVGHGDQVLTGDGSCSAGVGECRAAGTLICTGQGLVCDATPLSPPEPTEASCNDGLDNDCDGLIDAQDPDCAPPLPEACDTGNDPRTSDPWVVCAADANTAWISANSIGTYHAQAICTSLGYATVSQYGGTCGNVCGDCQAATSCTAPGNRTFDGQGNIGSDDLGILLSLTVMWECQN